MPDALAPYFDLTQDAGLALTDADYVYGLLINSSAILNLAGLLVLVGLIGTHGKSHGTRFSAVALFIFAALAGAGAWLLQPDAAAGTMLAELLLWSWVPALLAALAMFATMSRQPKPRALGLAFAMAVAIGATVFGGMLSVANARVVNPDALVWLDAPPMEQVKTPVAEQADETEPVKVLDTAHRK